MGIHNFLWLLDEHDTSTNANMFVVHKYDHKCAQLLSNRGHHRVPMSDDAAALACELG